MSNCAYLTVTGTLATLPVKSLIEFANSVHPVSEKVLNALLDISTSLKFKKNADVQVIGHTCKTVYFIHKGALRIYYVKEGKDITESLEFENAIVARVESLFSGRPSQKAIQAIEDTELIAIDANKLFILYDQYPELERLFRKIFELSHVKIINRMESLQFQSAEIRYAQLLREHPDILKRVPLKYIAAYLGITQVSLSRIRAKH